MCGDETAQDGRVGVALHFDESLVEYGQIDREVFGALLAVIPRERRDLRVALKLFIPRLEASWPTPTALAFELLGGSQGLIRSSHSVEAFSALIRTAPMAYTSIVGLHADDFEVLHEDLLDRSASYLGMVSLDYRLQAHVEFYGNFPQFRILGDGLRLLYSALEYSPEFGIEDTRPSHMLEEWRNDGLFSRVEWEEDEVQTQHVRKAADEYADWLRNGGLSGGMAP